MFYQIRPQPFEPTFPRSSFHFYFLFRFSLLLFLTLFKNFNTGLPHSKQKVCVEKCFPISAKTASPLISFLQISHLVTSIILILPNQNKSIKSTISGR